MSESNGRVAGPSRRFSGPVALLGTPSVGQLHAVLELPPGGVKTSRLPIRVTSRLEARLAEPATVAGFVESIEVLEDMVWARGRWTAAKLGQQYREMAWQHPEGGIAVHVVIEPNGAPVRRRHAKYDDLEYDVFTDWTFAGLVLTNHASPFPLARLRTLPERP